MTTFHNRNDNMCCVYVFFGSSVVVQQWACARYSWRVMAWQTIDSDCGGNDEKRGQMVLCAGLATADSNR